MEIFAIDPGKHCGWAKLDGATGIIKGFGTWHDEDEIWAGIIAQTPDVFVVEDYKVRISPDVGGFNHAWNNVFPAQVIGAIKIYAWRKKIPVVLQPATAKTMGAKMLFGQPYKKKSNIHHIDAQIHGYYYWYTTVRK